MDTSLSWFNPHGSTAMVGMQRTGKIPWATAVQSDTMKSRSPHLSQQKALSTGIGDKSCEKTSGCVHSTGLGPKTFRETCDSACMRQSQGSDGWVYATPINCRPQKARRN